MKYANLTMKMALINRSLRLSSQQEARKLEARNQADLAGS